MLHIFPYLNSKMKDTKAVLQKILTINEKYPSGLPNAEVNVGCDVKKLYPSVDKEMGLAALRKWLTIYPNPDGLSTELIMDPAQLWYCNWSHPHASAEIFMGKLDEKMVERLDEKGVENTGWTLYRDDGWLVAFNGMEDITAIEEILQNQHPNIEWVGRSTPNACWPATTARWR